LREYLGSSRLLLETVSIIDADENRRELQRRARRFEAHFLMRQADDSPMIRASASRPLLRGDEKCARVARTAA